jgi:hypothetical protein
MLFVNSRGGSILIGYHDYEALDASIIKTVMSEAG